MKKIILLALLLSTVIVNAQQDPLYAQYFNNPMVINPAFAGSLDRLYAGMAHRSQWSGLQGAPQSFGFNSHTAIVDNRVGVGLYVLQDKIGSNKNTFSGGVASYKIKLNSYASLSFGLQMGMISFASNTDDLLILNPDERFAPYRITKFNTGAGVLLKSDRYSLGASIPQMLEGSTSVGLGGQADVKVYSRNYYLFGSYIFLINERVEFKPSGLLRFTSASKPAVDLNANFTFNKLYTAGLLIRNTNTLGLLLQGLYKNARLGYMFELPVKSSSLRFTTHEVSLAFSVAVGKGHNALQVGL